MTQNFKQNFEVTTHTCCNCDKGPPQTRF